MVNLTETAATQIKRMLSETGQQGYGLRFGLTNAGCSGQSYVFEFEQEPSADDVVVEAHGLRVFVDPELEQYIGGSTIAWKDSLMETGIAVDNPNVKRSCGCGSSVEF